ncbi:MAG: hypothetical protein COS92_08310 [Desulfobacterales bacterium CG07_land_8_20_14_0_80_52_14]|nr:MAG: hypothetical protein COX20_10565 [Desulfobacterales bacterium CG23_combo_of_CG06-09_8_20_14_all_52_9]PIU49138.1 MAG: hypothetical protein COS92_08310 [Desulfobacterales bacterium CG07_land_8_20_14_0_80_52_14]
MSRPSKAFFRPYVKEVICRYLKCGILRKGFARIRCSECGHEYLLTFSCKRRHFCPSCHQKRVSDLRRIPDGCFHEIGNLSVQGRTKPPGYLTPWNGRPP